MSSPASPVHVTDGSPVLFYDGVCVLCNRAVRLLLWLEREGQSSGRPGVRCRLASLQGETARAALPPHLIDPPRSLVLLIGKPDDGTNEVRLLEGAAAVRELLRGLGGAPALLGRLLGVIPDAFSEALYRFVAQRRYRWFGRYDACPLPDSLPTARHAGRFLP